MKVKKKKNQQKNRKNSADDSKCGNNEIKRIFDQDNNGIHPQEMIVINRRTNSNTVVSRPSGPNHLIIIINFNFRRSKDPRQIRRRQTTVP